MFSEEGTSWELSGHHRLTQSDLFVKDTEALLDAPPEEVLAVVACMQIREAINDYLLAFLEINEYPAPLQPTTDMLLRLCQDVKPDFAHIDLKPLNCASCKLVGQFCSDINHVKTCHTLARKVGDLVHLLVDQSD